MLCCNYLRCIPGSGLTGDQRQRPERLISCTGKHRAAGRCRNHVCISSSAEALCLSLSGGHHLRILPLGLKNIVFLASDTRVNWEESSDISVLHCVNGAVSARLRRRGSRSGPAQRTVAVVCACVCVPTCTCVDVCACTAYSHAYRTLPEAYYIPKAFLALSAVLSERVTGIGIFTSPAGELLCRLPDAAQMPPLPGSLTSVPSTLHTRNSVLGGRGGAGRQDLLG